MDTKNFRDNLATRLGRRPADVDALIAALGHIVGHSCAELDSVAVPTFGTFVPVKEQNRQSPTTLPAARFCFRHR